MTAPAEHDVAVLAVRLDTGWTICTQEPDPDRKRRLEDHWLRLLHAYEVACNGGETATGAGSPHDRVEIWSGAGRSRVEVTLTPDNLLASEHPHG